MKYWYQNGSSCYLFKTQSRLSWRKSQEYCSEMGGYLVVIDSQEEQEYISQHINYPYDTYHGYWIGLAKKNNTWIWSTGAKVQGNGSWTKPPGNSQAGCVLSNPNKDNLNNWEVNDCSMLNRYICEMKAMFRTNPPRAFAIEIHKQHGREQAKVAVAAVYCSTSKRGMLSSGRDVVPYDMNKTAAAQDCG
ncbi:C-type lectin domain family 4 member A-like isoform X2 [Silurus meridionalis]|nr:C-type lectin domain family 4 member A-like isoform X2 [Silurus meridionalis]